MKVKVFQIDSDRDKNRISFANYDSALKYGGKIEPDIYNEVFSGDVECGDLEDVYKMFNLNHPLTHRGRSLSVSDVVSTEEGCYFCDSIGFKKIDFDESAAHKPDNLLRVLMIEPEKAPYETEIVNDLESMQRAVGGLIEVTYPFYDDDGTIIVSNDEAKLIGMDGNRKVFGELYAGPFFIASEDGCGNMTSLSDELINRYSAKFAQIEHYTHDDVENSIGFEIYPL